MCEGNVRRPGIFKFACLIPSKVYERFFLKTFTYQKKKCISACFFSTACLKGLWYVRTWSKSNVENKVKILRCPFLTADVYRLCVFLQRNLLKCTAWRLAHRLVISVNLMQHVNRLKCMCMNCYRMLIPLPNFGQ